MKQLILTLILSILSFNSFSSGGGREVTSKKRKIETSCPKCLLLSLSLGSKYKGCSCKKNEAPNKKRKAFSIAKAKKVPKCAKCIAVGKVRKDCKECGGSAYCTHGKQKRYCKECGGSAYCTHGRRKTICKECGGSAYCTHGIRKTQCKECGGSAYCTHGIRKTQCKECGGSAYCTHGKLKFRCKTCNVPCLHAEKLYKCKEGCYESWVQRKIRERSAASAAI